MTQAIGVTPPPPKYPRTPYWPGSPSLTDTSARSGRLIADPKRFVGQRVVITEKLDGSCTLLHRGAVYGRSVNAPSMGGWMAMVKKHHAWKMTDPGVFLYGEDIYGVHSIEYGAVAEDNTFHAFALRDADGVFASFRTLARFAQRYMIPLVPVLFDGVFASSSEIDSFIAEAHAQPSVLGGAREGVVMRLARSFPASEFGSSVCKSVRAGHVQTGEHWTRRWRPCRIRRATAGAPSV